MSSGWSMRMPAIETKPPTEPRPVWCRGMQYSPPGQRQNRRDAHRIGAAKPPGKSRFPECSALFRF